MFDVLPHRLWILGTDTGVGKTFVARRLAQAWAREGPVCYRKPFQTGVRNCEDPEADAWALRGDQISTETFVCLPDPLSPMAAAERIGERLDLEAAFRWCQRPGKGSVLLEGVGGLLVPLAPKTHFLAWATDLRIPALLVARGGLGTLNHTLLSAEALMMRGWVLAGILLNPGLDHSYQAAPENADLLRRFLPCPVEIL